jgi:hypothetical protein
MKKKKYFKLVVLGGLVTVFYMQVWICLLEDS